MTKVTDAPNKISPMMAQWHACKKMAKNAVLLFRMGDFYEAFYDDAALIAKELDLTLTKRQEVPMSGVPCHACDGYVDRLVSRGHRVAIAEQVEDPKQAKGLVKREVTRFVTPGTLVSSNLLEEKANNFFACVSQVGQTFGLALLDLTTAEFRVIEFSHLRDLQNECFRFHPAEFLVSEKFKERYGALFEELALSRQFLVTPQEEWRFDHQMCHDFLLEHFKVASLDGFGMRGMTAAINAAGSLLQYLQDSLCLCTDHVRSLQTYSTSLFLSLDQNTQRNLELTESLRDGSRTHTLLSVLDHTVTPMGGRLLYRWVKQPLLEVDEICRRQDGVQELVDQTTTLRTLREQLNGVRDLERLMMKISTGYAAPRDLQSLASSLRPLPSVQDALDTCSSAFLIEETRKLAPLPALVELLDRALVEQPPLRVSDGNIFREGYNEELDQLRSLSRDGKTWIAQYQACLREETGIKNVKVGYNRMFGYYIEVSKGQLASVPESFERKQTLVNAERYITPELKEYEHKVLTAHEKMSVLETDLFQKLREEVAGYSVQVMENAQCLARVDALQSLAYIALQNGYSRPLVDASTRLHIREGRHPVIEGANLGEKFIPNDTELDGDAQRLHIITGPNMAGKSTYIRQVALLTIMAQMGSFVPAESAHIGVVDKVFTRIGASDDLSRGQSTFMVEMTETAHILHHATDRSLVILDEIGRGTSTYDGISIAWAIAEYLLTTAGRLAKTLFATHYWELTDLEAKHKAAVNYNVAVREHDHGIVFLRKILRGGTDKSYGIHVGSLAGLPQPVIERAREILNHLEDNASQHNPFQSGEALDKPRRRTKSRAEVQFLLFNTKDKQAANPEEQEDSILRELRQLETNQLSPIDALNLLNSWKQTLESK